MRGNCCIFKYFIFSICVCISVKWMFSYTRFGFYTAVYEDMSCRLSKNTITLRVGERKKIRVIGINQRVVFVSSDFKVAEVDWGGNVYAHKKGRAIITVKTSKKVLKCKIKVID